MSGILGGYTGERVADVASIGKGIITFIGLNGGVLHQQNASISCDIANSEIPHGEAAKMLRLFQNKNWKIGFGGLNLHPDMEAQITGATKTIDASAEALTPTTLTGTLTDAGGVITDNNNELVELTNVVTDYHRMYQLEVKNTTDNVMMSRGDLGDNVYQYVVEIIATGASGAVSVGALGTQSSSGAQGYLIDQIAGTNRYFFLMTEGNFDVAGTDINISGETLPIDSIPKRHILFDDINSDALDSYAITYLRNGTNDGWTLEFDAEASTCETIDVVVSFEQLDQNDGCPTGLYYTWEFVDCVRDAGTEFTMPNGEIVTLPWSFTVNSKVFMYPAI